MRRLLSVPLAAVAIATALAAPAAEGFPNGRPGPGDLHRIAHPQFGHLLLERRAAAGWNTTRLCTVRRGVDIYPLGRISAYRSLAAQQYLYGLYRRGVGALAAYPGTSNHGLGRAVDLALPWRMRPALDRLGPRHGWRWGEVRSENWHVTYYGGFGRPDPGPSVRYPVLRRGSGGSCQAPYVAEVQRRVGLRQDGDFGPKTARRVCAFQRRKRFRPPCGKVDRRTWDALRAYRRRVRKPHVLRAGHTRKPMVGADVRIAQGLLRARFSEAGLAGGRIAIDGVYGPQTAAAVCRFQRLRGVRGGRCGVLDERTWRELRRPFRRALRRQPPLLAPRVLQRAMPGLDARRAAVYAPLLARAMVSGAITTRRRATYFLAQIGHESLSLRVLEEFASGAQYEGYCRLLGNCRRGDGRRYKGRGFIQLTGRANYRAAGRALRLPLEQRPRLAERPDIAARTAVWFWTSRGLNALADRAQFLLITIRINGGTNGLSDRQRRRRLIERLGNAMVPQVDHVRPARKLPAPRRPQPLPPGGATPPLRSSAPAARVSP